MLLCIFKLDQHSFEVLNAIHLFLPYLELL